MAFSAVASDVAAGMPVSVEFDRPIDASTLDASDLAIDGWRPATSVTFVDADRAVLTMPSLPNGIQAAAIAAGTIPNTLQAVGDAVSLSLPLGVEAQYTVKHTPRLQLGDAPLSGFAGSDLDQVEVLWQTVPAGDGSQDEFLVEYRLAGSGESWTSATNVSQIETGVGGRIVHSNPITGLNWDTDYEYRVRHLRAGVNVGTYQHTFHTRLPAGDATAFRFAAYGDSASGSAAGFREVQARINQVDPAFAVLLGDNVYASGTHDESDSRFDPSVNPEAAEWLAGHIDYLGLGNHDVATADGQPSEDNFAVPIPVAGVNAPAAPPASERDEHNFSFDYGDVHFVTFDTNALNNASRLDGLLDYVVADLNASTAQWKIVYGHHPIAGVPDKSQNPGNYYYQQVVSRLKDAGADLFMVGHSHTYSWTYPLTGQVDGQATFVEGPYNEFETGEGLPQLVSGVGGRSPREGDYSQFPFVAAGYTSTTGVPAELGFTLVDVTPHTLTVSYIAADDGATIDAFTITEPPDVTSPTVSTALDNGPSDFDPADGVVAVNSTQAEFQIQLSDRGDGIDDATVVGHTVSVIKNGGPLIESVDYTFDYDAARDTITVTPTRASFDNGTYVITLNGSWSQIADLAGNTMATTALSVDIDTTITGPHTLTFQQHVNGYAGAVDTYLRQAFPDADNAAVTPINVDGVDGGGPVQGLLRFESLIGDGAHQIPVGATIHSASLELQVTNPGNAMHLHRLLQGWADTDTWNSLDNGIQTNDVEASSEADAGTSAVSAGLLTIDVTASLTAWAGDPAANMGWALLSTGSNGVDFDSTEGTSPPRLVVEFLTPSSNDAPQAVDESYAVDEDQPLNVPQPGVLSNDADADGDPLTAVLVAGPASAQSFRLNSDGSFDYIPLLNFSSSDRFTYRAHDGSEASNIATVVITVNSASPVLLTPTRPRSAATVLADDAPAANFNSGDSFTDQSHDEANDSNVSIGTITLYAINDTPVAEDNADDVDQDTALNAPAALALTDNNDADGGLLTAGLVTGWTIADSRLFKTDGSLTETANPAYAGPDRFADRTHD